MAEQVIRWVTPFDGSRLHPRFTEVLHAVADDPGENKYLPFARLPMVHFASVIIFDEAPTPLLVFESNIDAPWRDYVKQLVSVGREALDCMYSGTLDYPPNGSPSELVERFFWELKQGAQLYHVGHPNRTVQEIRGDLELRRSIAHELDQEPNLRTLSPGDIVRTIRARANCPSLWFWQQRRPWNGAWNGPSRDPTPLHQIEWKADAWSWPNWFGRTLMLVGIAWLIAISVVVVLNSWISTNVLIAIEAISVFVFVRIGSGDSTVLKSACIAATFGFLVALPFLFPWLAYVIPAPAWAAGILVVPGLIVLSFLQLLWRLMTSEPLPVSPGVRNRVPMLLEAEDLPKNSHYNHVAGLSELKRSFRWLRCVRTWLALEVLNLFYRTEYVKGKLVTIPSIHFAQWSLVNRRYLLFLTNYDGPADSYLDDFFHTLAFGVAFMWQDTEHFPTSIDPRRLKMWVRQEQTVARVRYRAPVYDGLTVTAINNNTYIRKRLLRRRSASGARLWLRRFASIPEEPTVFSRVTGWIKQAAAGVRG